jgi:hypothetical protein
MTTVWTLFTLAVVGVFCHGLYLSHKDKRP